VTIYGITTKFGIRMHLYHDFQCTKFQGNRIMPLCFIATLRKEEEKKTKKLLKVHILNAWRDLVEIWNLRWWYWPAFSLLKSLSFISVMELRIALWPASFLVRMSQYRVSRYNTHLLAPLPKIQLWNTKAIIKVIFKWNAHKTNYFRIT